MLRMTKILIISFVSFIVLITILFGYQDIPVDELKSKYAQGTSAFVSIDDMEVHFRDEGIKSDSLPIVLIHGTGASLHTFDEWTLELSKTRRVVRMDLPGFGLTGPFPDGQYSMDRYVAYIHSFLNSRQITKCVLGGNSLGGRVSWNFTVKYPELVDRLILIDASGYPMKAKSVPIAFKVAGIPILNKALTFITPKFMARSSLENVYADKSKVTDELVDRYFELTLREGNRQGLVDRVTMKNDPDAHLLIKKIQQPTLLMWGEEDLLVPLEIAQLFQKDLPNNTLVILKNAGHVPMEESPKESLQPLLDFLNN